MAAQFFEGRKEGRMDGLMEAGKSPRGETRLDKF